MKASDLRVTLGSCSPVVFSQSSTNHSISRPCIISYSKVLLGYLIIFPFYFLWYWMTSDHPICCYRSSVSPMYTVYVTLGVFLLIVRRMYTDEWLWRRTMYDPAVRTGLHHSAQ